MSLDFSDESWRYVLAPAYVAAYRYGGQSYQVTVNGQTGAIAGQRPVDWTKVWLAVAAMVAPGLLLGLLGVLAAALGVRDATVSCGRWRGSAGSPGIGDHWRRLRCHDAEQGKGNGRCLRTMEA